MIAHKQIKPPRASKPLSHPRAGLQRHKISRPLLASMSSAEPIRLQKYLADAGICSRRSAEALIAQGQVWVNGAVAKLGQKVRPGEDRVTTDGKSIRATPQPRITLAMHKPRGLVCSNDDPHNPETVFTVLPREFAKFRFFCAGRLDKDSEGLVILTTDGDLAHRLMHPSNVVVKRYHVILEKPFPAKRLPLLIKGIVFEGERLKVERAALISPGPANDATGLDVHMHHGKKREIRLLFTTLGYDVKRLRRYQIGGFRLKGIPLRAMKKLTPSEIDTLFHVPLTPHAAVEATVASVASARAKAAIPAPLSHED
jgi:23S rRNA pseudouridine2605 synthase